MYHVLKYWNDFDGWAVSKGFDPLEIPSRRFYSAVWFWMIEGQDAEGIEKLHVALDQQVHETEQAFKTSKLQTVEQRTVDGKPKVIPLKPFQAPPGWKPPGWSDESAYANSIAGMKGVMNTGGGRIGGSVKKT